MVRTLRALVVAVLIGASLLGNGSVAGADTQSGHQPFKSPPTRIDITWE
ncbi:MAG TPA: hypothetical protein VF001_08805 [Candidatus Limnocylindria bacterium]